MITVQRITYETETLFVDDDGKETSVASQKVAVEITTSGSAR